MRKAEKQGAEPAKGAARVSAEACGSATPGVRREKTDPKRWAELPHVDPASLRKDLDAVVDPEL